MTLTVWTVVVLVVVALAIGGAARMFWRGRKSVTEPLGGIAWLYGGVLVIFLAARVIGLHRGLASVCVDTGYGAPTRAGFGLVGHGATLRADGTVQACIFHPSAVQWLLWALTQLPGLVLWAGLVLMIWRTLRATQRNGPFTQQSASAIRQLGWFVLIAPLIAGMLSHLGTDLLTRMVVTPQPFTGGGIVTDVLFVAAIKALFPVPALAGAGLLTFARISKVGVAMDEEIKATV